MRKRSDLMSEYRSIVRDYNDYWTQLSRKENCLVMYPILDLCQAFHLGNKTVGYGENKTFILPALREIMERIIQADTHHADRAKAMLENLNGEIARPFEPTYDELNPTPPLPKEYRLPIGSMVRIGTQQFEILAVKEDEVTVRDADFLLDVKDFPKEQFYERLKENPSNDRYLHVIEEPAVQETTLDDHKVEISVEDEASIEETGTEEPPPESEIEVVESKTIEDREEALEKDLPTEIPLAPPATVRKAQTPTTILYPEIPSDQRSNFRITDDALGEGTPGQRYINNVSAIRLLKTLEAEHRLATQEEQEVLSKYVGWGGLSHWFDDRHPKYQELKDLLTPEEYAAARESALTAFYTPPVVIRAIYQAMENMQFQQGNILEPSCGIGNFLGMLPDSMSESKLYGVELDSISGRIAQQLYQKSSIAVQGFERTELPDSFFDLAIGNVPFGQFKVSDKQYDRHNFLIHDYFFARTLDKVRPGGVVAFITSKGTMDKENAAVRKYIAQRADLLGAIRLPNNTFKAAAGTEVTSDILFLQKRDRIVDIEPEWVHLNTNENGIRMNQYFIDNPDMILGEMQMVIGPYGQETACVPMEGAELSELLEGAIQNIHGEVLDYEFDEQEEAVEEASEEAIEE